jgi:hypothetical protein
MRARNWQLGLVTRRIRNAMYKLLQCVGTRSILLQQNCDWGVTCGKQLQITHIRCIFVAKRYESICNFFLGEIYVYVL